VQRSAGCAHNMSQVVLCAAQRVSAACKLALSIASPESISDVCARAGCHFSEYSQRAGQCHSLGHPTCFSVMMSAGAVQCRVYCKQHSRRLQPAYR
jgi:hypothetical protein